MPTGAIRSVLSSLHRGQGCVLGRCGLSLALLCGGCSAAGGSPLEGVAEPGTLVVTPSYLPAGWLDYATSDLWSAAGLVVTIGPKGVPIGLLEPEDHDPEWYGGYHGGVILLDEETIVTSACSPSGVLAHELAHAFGAGHVDEGAGRMSPHMSGCEAWTEADLEELEAHARP